MKYNTMESSMRKRRKYIIFILALVVGFSILLYPVLSNLWNDYRAKQLTTSYQENVARLDEDRQTKMYEEAIAYNESLKDVEVPDAFSVRDGIEDKEYEEFYACLLYVLDILGIANDNQGFAKGDFIEISMKNPPQEISLKDKTIIWEQK